MPASFVRKHSILVSIVLATLFLMALPVQEARADNINLGNGGSFNVVFNSNPGGTVNLLNLFNLTGGLTDTQIFQSLGNPSSNTIGSSYLAAWQGILLGSGGSISLADANLFAELFGGTNQHWEDFFGSWWGKKHTAVPEPETLALLGCGILGLFIVGGLLKKRNPIS